MVENLDRGGLAIIAERPAGDNVIPIDSRRPGRKA
jgi:hypothetical protein